MDQVRLLGQVLEPTARNADMLQLMASLVKHREYEQAQAQDQHQTHTHTKHVAAGPFRLLDLPVECVVLVVSHVRDVRQRWFLINSAPEFHQVFANAKSCCGPVKLEIGVGVGYDGRWESNQPAVVLAYCGEPRLFWKQDQNCNRENLQQAMHMANVCPEKLQIYVYFEQAALSLVANLLDYMKEHEGSFIGSKVILTLKLNRKQQVSVPLNQVTQLLTEFQSHECSVALTLLTLPKLKLPKKADRLNDIRQFLSAYPFWYVSTVSLNNTEDYSQSTLLVDVPGCIDPATPSAALVNSLVKLNIDCGKHISSTSLNQILHTFTQITELECSVVYEADSSDAALDFHLKMEVISISLVLRPGESTTAAECDYYRCLLNRCPNAVHVTFKSFGKFSTHFTQTQMLTFFSTRVTSWRQLMINFEMPENPLTQFMKRKAGQLIDLDPQLSRSWLSSDLSVVLAASELGVDRLHAMLAPPIAQVLDSLGAHLLVMRFKLIVCVETCLAGRQCYVLFT